MSYDEAATAAGDRKQWRSFVLAHRHKEEVNRLNSYGTCAHNKPIWSSRKIMRRDNNYSFPFPSFPFLSFFQNTLLSDQKKKMDNGLDFR